MLLVKDSLQVTECNELNGHDFIEAVWCKLKFSRQDSLLIGVCYRSPRCTKEQNEKLNDLLRKIQLVQARDVMIMGDFNYGEIDWEDEVAYGPEDSDASKFLEVIQDLYLSQHVHQPTTFREGQKPSRLDLVFTNDKNMIDVIELGEPLGKSDHAVLTWDFKFRISHMNGIKAPMERSFNFFKADFTGMRAALQSTDWSFLNNLGVEEMWSHIKEVIESVIESHVPAHRKRKCKPAAPWWNNKLTKTVKQKHATWKRYCETKSKEDFEKYAIQRNKTSHIIHKARQEYEYNLVENVKKDPNKLYKYIRAQQRVKPIIQSLDSGHGLTESDSESAEVLQSFFNSAFAVEGEDPTPHFPVLCQPDQILEDIRITYEEVRNELALLNEHKSSGPDNIPMLF